MTIEMVILKCLSSNIAVTRTIIPFLKKEYFQERNEQALFLIANSYFKKYNSCPTQEVFKIEVDKLKDINEKVFKETIELIDKLEKETVDATYDWIIDNTETFCKDRSLKIAIQKTIEIYNGSDKKLTSTAIPSIMTDALNVSFDTRLGHD